MSTEETQRYEDACRERIAEISKEIPLVQKELIALAEKMGDCHRRLTAVKPQAVAKGMPKKRRRLVDINDPWQQMQAAWHDMLDTAKQIAATEKRLQYLQQERTRQKRAIAYSQQMDAWLAERKQG